MDNYPYLPYKECVELKELGFTERCLFAFDYSSTPILEFGRYIRRRY